MKKILFLSLILSFATSVFAQHTGHTLTVAKIAHDASHRVGRLVDTGRLEDVFLKNMVSLEISSLPHNQHTEPAFSVLVTAGTNNSQTLLTFDMSGKFLSNKLISQSPSEASPWMVDSSEIIEAALHFVMETSETDAKLKPFNEKLVKASLGQQTLDDGSAKPIVTLNASSVTKLLQVVLTPKGVVESYSLID